MGVVTEETGNLRSRAEHFKEDRRKEERRRETPDGSCQMIQRLG